jgi:hypothetical protein
MAILPNPLKATLNQAKQNLINTVSNTQIVGSLNQTMDQMKGAAKAFGSQFNTQIPGLDINLLGLDFPTPPGPLQDIENVQGREVKKLDPNLTFPLKNPLHEYASYNYIWTLSVLSPYDFNFPDLTYKKGVIHDIIIKSGSGNPDDRPELTPYAIKPSNPTGKYDFFIENARITGVIGLEKNTGNTNSTGLSFSVVEPYSIGLFFQSLSVAAKKNGYKNWVEMPVLLTLEFFGHVDFQKQGVSAEKVATKHFPMKITELDMKVSTEGSKYDCTAVPWNEVAYSKQLSTVKSDIQIEGATVQEMLQKGTKSLQIIVNNALKEQAKKQKLKVADQVLILFPINVDSLKGNYSDNDSSKEKGATVNPNDQSNNGDILRQLNVEKAPDGYNLEQKTNINSLGRSPLGYNASKKDRASFAKDGLVWDEKKQVYVRGSVTIKTNSGEASFKSGTDIPTIINQILLGSDYGRNALQNLDDDGYVSWWRIDTQVYIIKNDSNMLVSGRYPTIRVFRVIPYPVHHSRFLTPDQSPVGIKRLKEQAIKDYEYIYTGNNIEIINFNINFKSGFYNSLSADSGKSNIDVKRRNQQADVATDSKKENNQPTNEQEPVNPLLEDDNLKTQNMTDQLNVGANAGGPTPDDPATLAARQFHNAITRGGDMIELAMTILGDPFYIGDSGMGNYTAQASDKKGINSDLAINYQQGEVYVNMKFRNPVDINHEKGSYDFGSPIVPQFSGLYRVLQVESVFDKGMFTQNLLMYRMLNQDIDSKGNPFEGKEAEALANGLMPI